MSESKKPKKLTKKGKRKVKSTPPPVLNHFHSRYQVVGYAAKSIGWEHSTVNPTIGSLDWDVYWADTGAHIENMVRTAKSFQKVNHFPGMAALYRKHHLAKSIKLMKSINEKAYDFFPQTWFLPDEYDSLVAYHQQKKTAALQTGSRARPSAGSPSDAMTSDESEEEGDECFIVKPPASCQGKGIYLTMNPQSIDPRKRMVVQSYISRPLLIDGLKFDLRIYALVTCCQPLRVLVYREGLVRLCTTPYEAPNPGNLDCAYMHLTNYAVNKANPNFVQNNRSREGEEGTSKRSLEWLQRWMEANGQDYAGVWRNICGLIVKTLISAQCVLSEAYNNSKADPENSSPFTCFEVLGFDIMLDDRMKVHLIEVNHQPSFGTDSALDQKVKAGLLRNTFRLLNIKSSVRKNYMARSAMLRTYGVTYEYTESKECRRLDTRHYWISYLNNEKKYLGDFDLAYPADESADQPTAGEQMHFDFLLRRAEIETDDARRAKVIDAQRQLRNATTPAQRTKAFLALTSSVNERCNDRYDRYDRYDRSSVSRERVTNEKDSKQSGHQPNGDRERDQDCRITPHYVSLRRSRGVSSETPLEEYCDPNNLQKGPKKGGSGRSGESGDGRTTSQGDGVSGRYTGSRASVRVNRQSSSEPPVVRARPKSALPRTGGSRDAGATGAVSNLVDSSSDRVQLGCFGRDPKRSLSAGLLLRRNNRDKSPIALAEYPRITSESLLMGRREGLRNERDCTDDSHSSEEMSSTNEGGADAEFDVTTDEVLHNHALNEEYAESRLLSASLLPPRDFANLDRDLPYAKQSAAVFRLNGDTIIDTSDNPKPNPNPEERVSRLESSPTAQMAATIPVRPALVGVLINDIETEQMIKKGNQSLPTGLLANESCSAFRDSHYGAVSTEQGAKSQHRMGSGYLGHTNELSKGVRSKATIRPQSASGRLFQPVLENKERHAKASNGSKLRSKGDHIVRPRSGSRTSTTSMLKLNVANTQKKQAQPEVTLGAPVTVAGSSECAAESNVLTSSDSVSETITEKARVGSNREHPYHNFNSRQRKGGPSSPSSGSLEGQTRVVSLDQCRSNSFVSGLKKSVAAARGDSLITINGNGLDDNKLFTYVIAENKYPGRVDLTKKRASVSPSSAQAGTERPRSVGNAKITQRRSFVQKGFGNPTTEFGRFMQQKEEQLGLFGDLVADI